MLSVVEASFPFCMKKRCFDYAQHDRMIALFPESNIFRMFTYKDACHISGLIPFGFIGHVIINHFTVDLQVLETNVFHFPFFVIADNHGNFRILSRVGDVLKQNIFNTSTRELYSTFR